MTDVLHAVAEPRRREILRRVWRRELPAGEIAAGMDVTFAAVSQHLGVLRAAGLVTCRRDGRFRRYRACPEALGPLGDWLERQWRADLARLKRLAEDEERSSTGRRPTGSRSSVARRRNGRSKR